MLRDGLRVESAVAIAWHAQLDIADLGRDGLVVTAVARVPRTATSRVIRFVTKMIREFDLETGLRDTGIPAGSVRVISLRRSRRDR